VGADENLGRHILDRLGSIKRCQLQRKNGKEMTVGLSNSRYAELLLEFPPRLIRSEEELKQAQNAINSILDQGPMGQKHSTSTCRQIIRLVPRRKVLN
jgi:ribosome-associated translation inhibitor RaiA